ncbi:hypothetical protein SGRA_0309 [Saprospira grandis str. Lewin]|uniref:Uncharacterized protein n=1 Tax=Saprospira grandis (strain Lewin) TaxID=984262 RepID=H6L7L6_SAPGL|nr:hypothetical protein SGRA_0309 [Saprospira grandis str. Lewin]
MNSFFGASAAASPCGATVRSSQVCSALRKKTSFLLGLRLRRTAPHR